MDLPRQLGIARRRWLLIVAPTVVSFLLAFAITSGQPRVYEANTTLIVGQSLTGSNPDYNQLLVSQRLSMTYAAIATAGPILQKVVDALQLPETAGQLAPLVSATASQDTSLLTISVRYGEPQRAAVIADEVARALIDESPGANVGDRDLRELIEADLRAIRAEINTAEREIARLIVIPSPSPEEESALGAAQARLISLRSTFAMLLTASTGGSTNLLSVVQPAAVAIEPVEPRPLLYALLVAFTALLLASAAAFILEYLDDTMKDGEDIEEALGLSTLGQIARMEGGRGRAEMYRLVTILQPRSAVAEAYRTLRANLEFSSVDAPAGTLLVTSANPSEGKTVIAANLAVVFAQAANRVLLVDADFRRPGIHSIFNLPNDRGLSTLIRDPRDDDGVITHVPDQENLWILTSGPLPPNPTDLLSSKRMASLIERFASAYDLVMFDCAPVQVVSDALALSAAVDGTLYVVDVERTHRATAREGLAGLRRAGAHVLGVVLNRQTKAGGSAYEQYYAVVDDSHRGLGRSHVEPH